MRYTVETVGGDELEVHSTLSDATRSAVERLQDDPELGELYVYEVGKTRPGVALGEHVKTITHGPDANWDSVVVVLDPGEKVKPPDGSWRLRDEDGEAYDSTDPKHAQYLEILAGQWDNREKT